MQIYFPTQQEILRNELNWVTYCVLEIQKDDQTELLIELISAVRQDIAFLQTTSM
jgi:hypothetical protein